MSNVYGERYFKSPIFDYDYGAIADAIIDQYHPASVIEFGCGNGELTRALSNRGIFVTALDGYSNPDFFGATGIQFKNVDLNKPEAVISLLGTAKFDLAICMEVAEHLTPNVSFDLIKSLTTVSDVVVFSAAVPGQGGDGHVNCRNRTEWHEFFLSQGFVIADTIRERIRNNTQVGLWYRLNTIDYYKKKAEMDIPEYERLVKRLLAAESMSASECYKNLRQLQQRNWALKLQPVKTAVKFRNILTKLMRKTSIEFKD